MLAEAGPADRYKPKITKLILHAAPAGGICSAFKNTRHPYTSSKHIFTENFFFCKKDHNFSFFMLNFPSYSWALAKTPCPNHSPGASISVPFQMRKPGSRMSQTDLSSCFHFLEIMFHFSNRNSKEITKAPHLSTVSTKRTWFIFFVPIGGIFYIPILPLFLLESMITALSSPWQNGRIINSSQNCEYSGV